MSIEEDIAFLEGVPTLTLLGRDALRILAIGAESRFLRPGDILFRAGETSDSGYVVQEGELSLAARSSEGGHRVTVGRGTLIGEHALLAETTRPVTATALDDAVVMRISRSLFLKTMECFPEAAIRLREVLTKRAAETAREIYGVRTNLASDEKEKE